MRGMRVKKELQLQGWSKSWTRDSNSGPSSCRWPPRPSGRLSSSTKRKWRRPEKRRNRRRTRSRRRRRRRRRTSRSSGSTRGTLLLKIWIRDSPGGSTAFLIYFPNRALTSFFASWTARLGFFLTPMSRPGIKLTSVQLHLF